MNDARPISCEHVRVIEVWISVFVLLGENELLDCLGWRVRKEIATKVHEIGAVVSDEQHKQGVYKVGRVLTSRPQCAGRKSRR